MEEKGIIELMALCHRAIKETNSYVSFELSCSSRYSTLRIYIMDNGWDVNCLYDGAYTIYEDRYLKDLCAEDYKMAKEHLTRLLEKAGK